MEDGGASNLTGTPTLPFFPTIKIGLKAYVG
jgi:hypothetical protein